MDAGAIQHFPAIALGLGLVQIVLGQWIIRSGRSALLAHILQGGGVGWLTSALFVWRGIGLQSFAAAAFGPFIFGSLMGFYMAQKPKRPRKGDAP